MFLCSLLSMITMEEDAGMIDMLEGRDPTSDMTPSKRRRVDTVTVYQWKHVDEDGNELTKSIETFLDKDECLRQGVDLTREHDVFQRESPEVPIPTAEELMKTVLVYVEAGVQLQNQTALLWLHTWQRRSNRSHDRWLP